jgi:hypothetical protein
MGLLGFPVFRVLALILVAAYAARYGGSFAAFGVTWVGACLLFAAPIKRD